MTAWFLLSQMPPQGETPGVEHRENQPVREGSRSGFPYSRAARLRASLRESVGSWTWSSLARAASHWMRASCRPLSMRLKAEFKRL